MSKYRFTTTGRSHTHELDREDGQGYKPLYGTTTVINEVYPPPLSEYGARLALRDVGYRRERDVPDLEQRKAIAAKGQDEVRLAADMNIDDYMAFLEGLHDAPNKNRDAKAKDGKDVHARIEEYITWCLRKNYGKPSTYFVETELGNAIKPFIDWSLANVDHFLWSEANCYSEKLWVGGISDFGFVHKNGKVLIGDAKPSIYPKNYIQAAAYGLQIKENGLFDAEGNIVGDYREDGDYSQIDGYCIFDYNKGEARYLTGEWVKKLEEAFAFTVERYTQLDLIGSVTCD